MIYVSHLPKDQQDEIARVIRQKLSKEGLSDVEVQRAVEDALNSKYDDIKYMLDERN